MSDSFEAATLLLALGEAFIDFGELLRKCVQARAEPSQFRIHGLQFDQALDLWLHPHAILAQHPPQLDASHDGGRGDRVSRGVGWRET